MISFLSFYNFTLHFTVYMHKCFQSSYKWSMYLILYHIHGPYTSHITFMWLRYHINVTHISHSCVSHITIFNTFIIWIRSLRKTCDIFVSYKKSLRNILWNNTCHILHVLHVQNNRLRSLTSIILLSISSSSLSISTEDRREWAGEEAWDAGFGYENEPFCRNNFELKYSIVPIEMFGRFYRTAQILPTSARCSKSGTSYFVVYIQFVYAAMEMHRYISHEEYIGYEGEIERRKKAETESRDMEIHVIYSRR